MRIGTKLRIAAAMPALLAVIIAVLLFSTYNMINFGCVTGTARRCGFMIAAGLSMARMVSRFG